MPEEQIRMLQKELEALRHEMQNLTIVLQGSASLDIVGIFQRLKELEKATQRCDENTSIQLERLERDMDARFDLVMEKLNASNTKLTEQLLEFHMWKTSIVNIFNFVQSKNLWKAVGIIIFIGMVLITWNKLGFDFFFELLKRILL